MGCVQSQALPEEARDSGVDKTVLVVNGSQETGHGPSAKNPGYVQCNGIANGSICDATWARSVLSVPLTLYLSHAPYKLHVYIVDHNIGLFAYIMHYYAFV